MRASIFAELERRGIPFEATPFPRDLRTVEEVAELVGMVPARIAKALLIRVDCCRSMVVALPGSKQLDLCGLAARLELRSVRLAKRSQVCSLAGVEVGAVTPLLAMVRGDIDVVLDTELLAAPTVNVSSGDPRCGISLAPGSIRDATGAAVVALD
jgi:Cys-tRNA(Pro)/Cys-tRNA(Cys) deacylase